MKEQQEIELVDGKFIVKGKKEVLSNEQKVAVKQYSLEVIALRDRIIGGNQKLFEAWLKIRNITDKEEKTRQFDRWNEAQTKLHYLCLELKAKGYEDCLYLDVNGKKIKKCLNEPDGWWCQVCPSNRPYWGEELLSL